MLGANSTYHLGSSGQNGTEAVAAGILACAGTFGDLYVKQNVVPGGAQTTTYTLMKNGVATALTCHVSAAGTLASDTNAARNVTFAKGDTCSIKAVNSFTAAGTIPIGGICFQPTVV